MNLRRGAVALTFVVAAAGCGKSEETPSTPAAPSSAPNPNARAVDLTVNEGSTQLGIRLTPNGPPYVAYSGCRGLQNVSGTQLTFTYEMEVMGEDGSVYPTFNTAQQPIVLQPLDGFFGCGTPRTYDFDFTHQTARTYRMRVRYQTQQGVSGVVEGTAPLRPLPQALPHRLIVNEFRSRGPNGPEDQFIELYNDSLSAVPAGFFLYARANSNLSVPQAFVTEARIGPRCHFLLAGPRYSGAARPDGALALLLTDDGSMSLNTHGNVDFTEIDRVGMNDFFSSFEGTPLPAFGAANTDRSYVRTGRDTNDNLADFVMRGPSTPQNSNDCGAR